MGAEYKVDFKSYRYHDKIIESWRNAITGKHVARAWAFGQVLRADGKSRASVVRRVKRMLDAHLRGPLGPERFTDEGQMRRHTRRTHASATITSTHYAVETSAQQQRALIAIHQAERFMGSTPGTRRARKWFDEGHYSSAEREARKALSANRKRPKKRNR